MADNIIDILRFIDKDGNTYTANMDRLVFVHLKGDENIKGRKTFDEAPLIPSYAEGDPETEAINAATLKKYIDELDDKAVSTSNRNQTVDGIKTFKNLKSEVTELQNSAVIKNTNPRCNDDGSSANLTSTIDFTDNTGLTSSGNLISQIKSTTNSTSSKLALKAQASNGKSGTVTVEVDGKGRAFATAPTVNDVNDVSSKVVTTEFLRNYTLNLIYPVGAVYISTVKTNPGDYLGGNWKRIEGKFLVGAVDDDEDFYNGAHGGYKVFTPEGEVVGHILTVDELAAHGHGRGTQNITGKVLYTSEYSGSVEASFSGSFYQCEEGKRGCSDEDYAIDRVWGFGFDASRSWTGTSEIIGKNKAHNHGFKGHAQKILPPYLAVYMFMRIADDHKNVDATFTLDDSPIVIRETDTYTLKFDNDNCNYDVSLDNDIVSFDVDDYKSTITIHSQKGVIGHSNLNVLATRSETATIFYKDKNFDIPVTVEDVTVTLSEESVAIDGDVTHIVTVQTNGDSVNVRVEESNGWLFADLVDSKRNSNTNILTNTYRIRAIRNCTGTVLFDAIANGEVLDTKTTEVQATNVPFIDFTCDVACSNMNFFKYFTEDENNELVEHDVTGFDVDDFDVYINDKITTQKFNNLTIAKGQRVKIYKNKNVASYPCISFSGRNHVSAINMPLPYMTSDGYSDADFTNLFKGCTILATIPSNLFLYNNFNTLINTFFGCTALASLPVNLFNGLNGVWKADNVFSGCTKLTIKSIPEDLFRNISNVTDMKQVFKGCTALASLPSTLFKDCVALHNLEYVFENCTALATIPADLFSENFGIYNVEGLFAGCTKLVNIPKDLFKPLVNVTSFAYCFKGCTALANIKPAGNVEDSLFSACEEVTSFEGTFYGCNVLKVIPTDLFRYNTRVSNFKSTFENCIALNTIDVDLFRYNSVSDFDSTFKGCKALVNIPSDLFKYNVDTLRFTSTFENCIAIKAIPAGLFAENINAESYNSTFKGCNALVTIPIELFASGRHVYELISTFENCITLKKLPEDLFQYFTDVQTLDSVFKGCKVLTLTTASNVPFFNFFSHCENLSTIISLFENCVGLGTTVDSGLFAGLANISEINAVFKGCTSIKTIPTDLFSSMLALYECKNVFENCTALTTLSGDVFKNNTNISDFRGCFKGCTALVTIPTNLFWNCTGVTSFDSVFCNCKAIKTIPYNIFDNCPYVRSFRSAFEGCVGLTAIDAELFKNNIAATDFYSCFKGCANANLKIIPSNLFKNTVAETMDLCFSGCVYLTSIPADLFEDISTIKTFSGTFSGCTRITAIPSKLFEDSFDAEDFSSCFENCTSITAIPGTLFENTNSAKRFNLTFSGCTAVTGLLPELWNTYESAEHRNCFAKCTKATNYKDATEYDWI